jgi:Family of unknown function (DUF6516)
LNTLASLLSWTISQLEGWPAASNIRTLESETFGEDRFHFKVRADLQEPHKLQIRFYYNRGHLDYAYQLFADTPVLRWDNKEDAGQLATAPHHFHDESYAIGESALTGDPAHDWPIVRAAIEQFLSKPSGPGKDQG